MDELQRARVELLRAQLAFVSGHGSDAPPLLLKAAKRLEPLDVELARETYLNALSALLLAGRAISRELGWSKSRERRVRPLRRSTRRGDRIYCWMGWRLYTSKNVPWPCRS